ncbi:MAG: hypothetical protein EXR62_01300 [Chloroflexi bacterium]|nr:hypothetical protein [Chloroflexota bacterium]
MVQEARAPLVGIGVVIEKSFEQGRNNLVDLGGIYCSRLSTLRRATIVSMKDGHPVIEDES